MRYINYLLFVSIFSAVGFMGIVYTIWHNGDAVTKKNIETDILLFKHALIDQRSELKSWIREHHGEEVSSAIITKFVKWGLKNQQEFLKIISTSTKSTEPKESAPITDKIAYAIYHGGSDLINTFRESYKNVDSADLKKIYKKLTQLEQEQDKNPALNPSH